MHNFITNACEVLGGRVSVVAAVCVKHSPEKASVYIFYIYISYNCWGECEQAPPLMMSPALASVVLVRLADCACAIFT